MNSYLALRSISAVECGTADCQRPASIVVSMAPLIVLCSWCALARHETENGRHGKRVP
jgi:hypothetical protein